MDWIPSRVRIAVGFAATTAALTFGCGSEPTPNKVYTILQAQKAASEAVTRRAVDLIKAERIPDVRRLYKDRWNELATLRTDVTLDASLTAEDKATLDLPLRTEQESITEILAMYERLYGP